MSRPQQYTDDLRLAHILADSVDRVSAMRFRDRPVFSRIRGGRACRGGTRCGTVGAVAAGYSAARGLQAPVQEPADYAWGVAQEVEELLRAAVACAYS